MVGLNTYEIIYFSHDAPQYPYFIFTSHYQKYVPVIPKSLYP